MRTVTKSKRRQFEIDLYNLLVAGLAGTTVDVTQVRTAPHSKPPRVYVTTSGADNQDKVDYVRDEAGPLLDNGKHVAMGECGFSLWVDVKLAQGDTQHKGLLSEEADLRAELAEYALKYGGALEEFQNERLRIEYIEALPTVVLRAVDETDLTALVWIKGHIKYKQFDR